MSAPRTLTPMMRQYFEIKDRHRDAILLFRMGDFFEIFFEDALTAAPLLDLTLTSRDKESPEPIPFCGFPHHQVDAYVAKLIAAGRRVAVCDQVEDPAEAKGIVRREVVRIVTPGMVVGGELLAQDRNNYLASIQPGELGFGLVLLDVSTGDFRFTEVHSRNGLVSELDRYAPTEVLHPDDWDVPREVAQGGRCLTPLALERFSAETGAAEMARAFPGAAPIDAPLALGAIGAALGYVAWTQQRIPPHLVPPARYDADERLVLDPIAERNLELVRSLVDGGRGGTLLAVVDRTRTPMGARLLRRWLLEPLVRPAAIEQRHDAVQVLVDEPLRRAELAAALAPMGDLERLNAKVTTGRAHARDLVALAAALEQLPGIKQHAGGSAAARLESLADAVDPLGDLVADVRRTLVEAPPLAITDGGLVRDGVNPELDEARSLTRDGKSWIARLEAAERERAQIPKLKVGYNRVFGYYLEVPNSFSERVPATWIRKQTLVGAERYVTPELKEMEAKILGAEERAHKLELEIFQGLRERAAAEALRISATASAVAELDALASFAEVAAARRYVRPRIDESGVLDLADCRHPVVEANLGRDRFVPNDVRLDVDESQVLLITGPNMAGKSTYMRQVALAVVLAQAGSFVPAARAHVGVVDRVFTRVGASDRLAEGQSTFMVEMVETAQILEQATSRSLVLLDEIGRGTSTYDGLSIAWAVGERLHEGPARPRTLFATHYHELTELARQFPRIQNFNVAVREWGEEILFLHRIVPGSASRSYGIHVARLAGLPEDVIRRAREVLAELESGSHGHASRRHARRGAAVEPSPQLELFRAPADGLKDALAALAVEAMTPLEALNELDRLVRRARGDS
ncbi:MAG: DNA mismatch repair protein MutS [bacterium]